MKATQQHKTGDFLGHVLQILADKGQKSLTYYSVGSFVETFKKFGLKSVDNESLTLWIASMFLDGMKLNTVKRYSGRLHTMYSEWRSMGDDDPFIEVQSAIALTYQLDNADVLFNLEMLKRLFDKNETSDDWEAVSMFFYLLYDASATLLDAAETTFDSALKYCPQIDELVKSRNRSNGRKYIFDFEQWKIRPSQLSKEFKKSLTLLMKTIGMKISVDFVREEITAIWIAAAMKCGISIRDIRAIIPAVPYRYRALSLIPKTEISEVKKLEIICQVADAINDNTPRWFVMKLRKGVALDDITKKIDKELPGRLQTMELFYPTRTEAKKVGKKIIYEHIPYVPNMLFFRTQYNKIRSLFAKIGDMAWCFKVSRIPNSRYSVIPHEEMANFQRCVGQFTSDMRIELVKGSCLLDKGRMVRITGGMMNGYKGKIEDMNDDKGTRKFYLRISNDNMLNWTAVVDEVFIEPLIPKMNG